MIVNLESSRSCTLNETLVRLCELTGGAPVQIVEVGTIRDSRPSGAQGDGWALCFWGEYVRLFGGRVTSIDSDSEAFAHARKVAKPWLQYIDFIVGRGEDVLSTLSVINLLYLDGPPDAEPHLRMWEALRVRPLLVLFDDILESRDFTVKGTLAIPRMLTDGYRLIFVRGRQALLERSQ